MKTVYFQTSITRTILAVILFTRFCIGGKKDISHMTTPNVLLIGWGVKPMGTKI
jgi:Flp pilus assembly protein protease CpaA